jgi:hypothetical protein
MKITKFIEKSHKALGMLAMVFMSEKAVNKSPSMMKILVSEVPNSLKNASDNIKDNKEIALIALKKDSHFLYYLSERLRDDKEVVLAALKSEGERWKQNSLVQAIALSYASDRLRDDEEFIKKAISLTHNVLRYTSKRLLENKDIVIKGLSKNGEDLHYVSDKLKTDKEVILVAITNNASAISSVSKVLQNDEDIARCYIGEYYKHVDSLEDIWEFDDENRDELYNIYIEKIELIKLLDERKKMLENWSVKTKNKIKKF